MSTAAFHHALSAFRLIQEPDPNLAAQPEPVEVPAGVSVWSIREGGLTPLPGDRVPDAELLLEPVKLDSKPHLLLVDHGDRHLRVNDLKVAGVTLLRQGDQVRVDFGAAWEIALYHDVRIGPPTPAQIGSRCPVCLGKFTSTTLVLACACGNVFHLESEPETEGAEPRKCALVISTCPGCHQPVRQEPGYVKNPVFLTR